MKMNVFIKPIAAVALCAIAAPALASGTCKDAYIKAENKTGKQIKVVDMHYNIRGYGKKSEPIKNSDIPAGQFFTVTRNLEKANGRDTQIVVVYRERKKNKGFDQWTGLKKASSDYTPCSKGAVIALDIR